ncbi:unnamed protein product [Rotaria magnacalcarata]|uniref:VCBS repeat-containing protein n=2 Tax=Rotaria magnacalcarata TaxID=392030 RepID=A0A815IAC1_9BILA|nr:unnamed protein product [Rotaria magnacalcarata]
MTAATVTAATVTAATVTAATMTAATMTASTSKAQCSTIFINQTTYSTDSNPDTLKAADVNDDGKPDIIVANYGSNNVGVFLNTGNGTFSAQTNYSTGSGSGPYSVVAVDVNGDGQPDIIVANAGSNNIGVLLNHC